MRYHDKYFEGSAWLILGISRFTTAKAEGCKMGEAAGTVNHAEEIFNTCGPILKNIPNSYVDNF